MQTSLRIVRRSNFLTAALAVSLTFPAFAKDPFLSPEQYDASQQGTSGTLSGPTGVVPSMPGVNIGVNFTGSSINQSGFIPPDTMGAVGSSDIVEILNGRYAVYDKTGSFVQGKSLNAFWSDAGVSTTGFTFDPRVVYDPTVDRYFAAAVDNGGNANNILLAVSDTSSASGSWTGFTIDSDTNNDRWADFPLLGVTGDRVTVTANMFPTTAASATTAVFTLPKADLLGVSPTVANVTKFEDINPNNTGFTPQPILDLDFNTGNQLLLSSYNKGSGFLKTSTLTGTPGTPTLNTSGGFISVTARNGPGDVDQPGTANDLDAGDTRFSGNVVQQQITGRTNPTIWGVHSVLVNGREALEWYEIDSVTNAVLQSGLISDDSLEFNYGSIAVNDNGDVVIGFSGADATTFASTYAVVGSTDSGVTTFSDLILTQSGTDEYENVDGSGRNRWGDYSATVLDFSDPSGNTFWTFQEFALSQDVWAIQITEINIPEPTTGLMALIGFAGLAIRRRRG